MVGSEGGPYGGYAAGPRGRIMGPRMMTRITGGLTVNRRGNTWAAGMRRDLNAVSTPQLSLKTYYHLVRPEEVLLIPKIQVPGVEVKLCDTGTTEQRDLIAEHYAENQHHHFGPSNRSIRELADFALLSLERNFGVVALTSRNPNLSVFWQALRDTSCQPDN